MTTAQLNHYFEILLEQDQAADHCDGVTSSTLRSPPREGKGLQDTQPTTSVRSSATRVISPAITVSEIDKETLKTPDLENHDKRHPVDKNKKSEDDDYVQTLKAIGDSTKNEEKRSSRSWRSRGRLSYSSTHRGNGELTKSEHGSSRLISSSRNRRGSSEFTKSEHGSGRLSSSSRHRGRSGELTKSEHGSSDELRRSRRRSKSKTRRSSNNNNNNNNNKPTEGDSANKSPGRPTRKSAISESSSTSPGRPRRKKSIGGPSKLSSRGSQVVTKDEISSSRHSRVHWSGGGSTRARSSSLTRWREATRGGMEKGNKQTHSDSGSVYSYEDSEPERPKSMSCLVESFEPQNPVTLKSPKKDDQNPSRRRSSSRTRVLIRGRRSVAFSHNKKEASPTPNDSNLTDKEGSPTPQNDNKATKDSQTPNIEAIDKETSIEDALFSLPYCDNAEASKCGFNAESSKGGFFAGFSTSCSRFQDDLANLSKPSEGDIFPQLLSNSISNIRVQPKVDAQPKADLISFLLNTSFATLHNSQASGASLDEDTLIDSVAIVPCPEDEEETVVADNLHLSPEKLQQTDTPIHSSPTKSPDWRKAMPSRDEKMPVGRSRSMSPSSQKPQQGNAAEPEEPKVSGGAFNSNRADHFLHIGSLDALLQAEPNVKRSCLPEPSICSSCLTSPLRGSSGKRQDSLDLVLPLFEAKFVPLGDDGGSVMLSPLPRPPTSLKSVDLIGSVQEDVSPGKKDFLGSGFSEFLSPPRPPTRGMSLDSTGFGSVQEDLLTPGTKDFGSGFSSPPPKKPTSLESIDWDNRTPTTYFWSRSDSPSPKKPGRVKSLGPGEEEEAHRKTPSSSRRHSSINSWRKGPDFLHRGDESATTKYLQLDLSNMDGEAVFFQHG